MVKNNAVYAISYWQFRNTGHCIFFAKNNGLEGKRRAWAATGPLSGTLLRSEIIDSRVSGASTLMRSTTLSKNVGVKSPVRQTGIHAGRPPQYAWPARPARIRSLREACAPTPRQQERIAAIAAVRLAARVQRQPRSGNAATMRHTAAAQTGARCDWRSMRWPSARSPAHGRRSFPSRSRRR